MASINARRRRALVEYYEPPQHAKTIFQCGQHLRTRLLIMRSKFSEAQQLSRAGEFSDAAKILRDLVNDDSSEQHINLLCACLLKLEDFESCVGVLQEHGGRKKLSHTQARLLGASLTQLARCDEATTVFKTIPDISGNPRAAQDYALNLLRMGAANKAHALLKKALVRSPKDSRLRLQEGLLGLRFGIDKRSRDNYYQRHAVNRTETLPERLGPLWRDSELSGKHILLWGEQGIGDELIFFLVLSILKQTSVSCSVACDPRLIELLKHNFPGLHFVIDRFDRGAIQNLQRKAQFDFQARVGDLWQLVEINKQAIPNKPLLFVPNLTTEEYERKWSRSISQGQIGISWFSGEQRNNMPDEILDRLLSDVEGQWLNLQHIPESGTNMGSSIIRRLAERPPSYTANDNFCRYGAAIKNTKLVISNDSTAGVFSTLLGMPTIIITPNDPYWFWTALERISPCHQTTVLQRSWNAPWDEFYTSRVLPVIQAKLAGRSV